jgi:2-oxoglutarate ferredoxin oxidoreductase subunit beta
MAELLATLGTPGYIARGSAHDPPHVLKTKKLIKKAFEHQMNGTCFSFVEVLSTCPTNWGLAPGESGDWVRDHMIPQFPLGVIKEPGGTKKAPGLAAPMRSPVPLPVAPPTKGGPS